MGIRAPGTGKSGQEFGGQRHKVMIACVMCFERWWSTATSSPPRSVPLRFADVQQSGTWIALPLVVNLPTCMQGLILPWGGFKGPPGLLPAALRTSHRIKLAKEEPRKPRPRAAKSQRAQRGHASSARRRSHGPSLVRAAHARSCMHACMHSTCAGSKKKDPARPA